MAQSKMNLDQIAAAIYVHLNALERDEEWNIQEQGGLRVPRIFHANAWSSGMCVIVSYVEYQSGGAPLSKAKALEYLEWLEAGNKGTHMTMDRAAETESKMAV
jgi:hypothetical protein